MYQSTHTGAQVEEAVDKALSPDATPTENSTELVTSGGVFGAMAAALPHSFYLGRKTPGTVTIDIGQYMATNSPDGSSTNALLVICKSWTTGTNVSSAYLITSIQKTNYIEAIELGKGASGPTVSVSGTTMTITWTNSSGGDVVIVKLA